MTVRELIEALSKIDGDKLVVVEDKRIDEYRSAVVEILWDGRVLIDPGPCEEDTP